MTNDELIVRVKAVDTIDDFLSLHSWEKFVNNLEVFFLKDVDVIVYKIEELFGSVEELKKHFDDLK